MKHVVIDFDNTMGVKGCDVDDGLALLYLLGNPDRVRVEAACTTYGNSTIETVHGNTLRLFAERGLDIPVHRGGASAAEPISDAARFLAAAAAERPGELSVLATGSLTNLRGAALIDPCFFGNLAEVVLMGGITQSLVINGRIMDELNLSCDPAATAAVLGSGARVSIATAHHCLPAFFRREDFARRFGDESWLARTCAYWFEDMDADYAWRGFACWDLVAAAYLAKPELFHDEERVVTFNERLFTVGYLEDAAPDAPQARVNTPVIADADALVADALASWERALA